MDGTWCFESTRTGTRQIWSMLADGSQPRQLTFKDRTNRRTGRPSDGASSIIVRCCSGGRERSQADSFRDVAQTVRRVQPRRIFPRSATAFSTITALVTGVKDSSRILANTPTGASKEAVDAASHFSQNGIPARIRSSCGVYCRLQKAGGERAAALRHPPPRRSRR